MNIQNRPCLTFIAFSALAFLVSHVGFDIFARVYIANEKIVDAAQKAFYYFYSQPIAELWLAIPYLVLGLLSASIAKNRVFRTGSYLFSLGVILLGILYWWGHLNSQISMRDHHWTASVFDVMFLPLESIPILIILLVVYFITRKNKAE